MRAWSYFDPERYAEKVIAALGVKNVEVSDLRCLQGLGKVPAVNHVTITGLRDTDLDLSTIDRLPVPKIAMKNCGIRRVIGAARSRSPIREIAFISCHDLSEIDSIARLPNLEIVEILDCEFYSSGFSFTPTGRISMNARILNRLRHFPGRAAVRIGYFGVDSVREVTENNPLAYAYLPMNSRVFLLPRPRPATPADSGQPTADNA